MNWSDIVAATFGLAGVLVGSLITVWFQSKDRKERLAHEIKLEGERRQQWIDQQWWQRKADAYSRIVSGPWEALNEYQYRFAIEIGEASKPSAEEDLVQQSNAHETWRLIRQSSDIGEFIISADVSNALHELSESLESNGENIPPNWFEYYGVCVRDTQKCLETVRKSALRDLGIQG